MQKVKSLTVLALSVFFTFFLVANSYARQLTATERKEYAQNNIIFYVPCDSDSENSKTNCNTNTTTETPETPETPEDPENPETPVATGNCACPNGCGKQNANGMESQNDGHDTYQTVLWKKYDQKDVQASGCSLVSVVNAANALGQSHTIKDTAAWTLSNLDVQTGSWDGTVKPIATNFGLELTGLFDNVHSGGKKVSTVAEKLALIKQALASGKIVIASGAVTEVGSHGFKACANRATLHGVSTQSFANAGNCIFSPGGHYVAIIGVTADDKLVIANPALGSKSATGWIFPANNALEYADIAKAVGTKGSGGLISCSENNASTAAPSTNNTNNTNTTNNNNNNASTTTTSTISRYSSPASSTGPTTTWNFKGTKFIVVNTKTAITDYATYVQNNGVKQDSNEAKWGGACMSFAETFGYDMYKGTTHTGSEASSYKCSGIWKYKEYSNKSDLLATIYNQIKAGKPVVLHVSSKTRTNSRHFVTVVGFKSSVSSASNLKESDLLILDTWDGELERMDGTYPSSPRVLTTGKQTGRSYNGYYAATIR